MTQPDWGDDRLDAAFHARFDRPAPSNLTMDVHVRIAGTSPARFGSLRDSPTWSLVAAAVVVVLVAGTALIGLAGFGRSGGPPLPSDVSASAPAPSATPTEQAIPGVVLGLPLIRVPDAIAIRDAGVDDREIAVAGWFTPSIRPVLRCAASLPTRPLQIGCGDDSMWLTLDAEPLIHRIGQQIGGSEPVGPALRPDLSGLDVSWQPADFGIGSNGKSVPTDVVFVGHFDDRRAASCPEMERTACQDRFVVDSVAIVHGVQQPASTVVDSQGTTSTDADVSAIIANEAPGSPILSMELVDGPTGLATIEPSLGTGQEGLIGQPILWLVRVLESERAVTYIVIDGSDAIYEMNPEGRAILVGGTPPRSEATASPGPWPPAGALVLDLPNGIGKPPVRVAIVDDSGRFVSAMEQDPPTISPGGRFGAYAEPDKPGRVNLTWVGGICDSRITIRIAADLRSITFDMGPQPDCDSIGVARELIMHFSGTVDVPAIQVGEGTAGASPPPPQGPENVVDCGPLGPDTCQAKAHDIVAASPGKSILTITFTDECGSYTATYVNGNGIAATIDCIPGASPG